MYGVAVLLLQTEEQARINAGSFLPKPLNHTAALTYHNLGESNLTKMRAYLFLRNRPFDFTPVLPDKLRWYFSDDLGTRTRRCFSNHIKR